MGDWIGEKVSGFVGGIVDGVKGVLGIRSPSRVFAGIGENMALGLGDGWDSEYDRISKNIESGMDFGAAYVDISGKYHPASGDYVGTESGLAIAPQTFILQLPNGDALASFIVDIMRGEARMA